VISASGMLGLFMYFVIALSSVWFYRSELRRSVGTTLLRGVLPLLGGLFMGLIFFYGLTTQAPAVAWVSVAGVVLVYVLGIVVRAVAPRLAQREDRGHAQDSAAEPR
jgi:L-asparagine transporter-like permease